MTHDDAFLGEAATETDDKAAEARVVSSHLARVIAGQRVRNLRGFSLGSVAAGEPTGERYEFPFEMKYTAFSPLLSIVLETGVEALNFPNEEKVAWKYAFEFHGVPCRLRHGKTGIRLEVWLSESDNARAESIWAEVQGRLTSAASALDREVVQPRARKEVAANRVTLLSQYDRYRGMVEYFVRLLRKAQAIEPVKRAHDHTTDPLSAITSAFVSVMSRKQHERERAYVATALLASYFSYIQHILLLLSAFTRRALAPDFNTYQQIGAPWAEQFDTVFPPPHAGEVGRAKADLEHLASTYRNPLLHGGGGRPIDGMTVEWAPGRHAMVMGDGQPTDQFMLWQPSLTDSQIDDILARIVRIDAALREHQFFHWIELGIPVPFNPTAVKAALNAVAQGAVEKFIEKANYFYERDLNWER